MEFLSKFTDTDLTPGKAATVFSTLAEQAAQLIPVTTNFSLATLGPSVLPKVALPST
jgi:hypothetical protein